jgi:hypothetical protein
MLLAELEVEREHQAEAEHEGKTHAKEADEADTPQDREKTAFLAFRHELGASWSCEAAYGRERRHAFAEPLVSSNFRVGS